MLQEQFDAPLSSYPELPAMPAMPLADCPGGSACRRDHYSMFPLQVHFFRNALYGPDQLRQRVAFALSQILVVSGREVTLSGWMRSYQQLLYERAFGNYKQLLYDVTRSPAMGAYLDALNNRCQRRTPANVEVCRNGLATKPNENYARELLQLFAVGLYELNADGTVVVDGQGRPVSSYEERTVEEFSRVMTGWILAPAFGPGIPNYAEPMRVRLDAQGREDYHDFGPKTLLGGQQLPGGLGADADLRAAVANIAAHPSHAPFISRLLIQQLVTSNPTPDYIRRVADVFAANVDSPTQMREVVRAILLDPEARGDVKTSPEYGKLREPVLFVTSVLRAFNATSDGVLTSVSVNGSAIGTGDLGQAVFNSPSVFNFYAPDFPIAGTDPPLVGPSFQLQSTVTALRRANFVNQVTFSSIPRALPDRPAGTSIDVTPYTGLANHPEALVAALDRLLMHGSMPGDMRNIVLRAVSAVPSSSPLTRVRQAVYLITSSSQYQVVR